MMFSTFLRFFINSHSREHCLQHVSWLLLIGTNELPHTTHSLTLDTF